MKHKIYDDVFRTICQKMPGLLVGLINEVFETEYPNDVSVVQLRNEHLEKYGKIITDALIQIGDTLYHLECQSSDDHAMIIRMIEYDFAIALEEAWLNGTPYRMRFPQSCVIYIRDGSGESRNMQIEVELPDGNTFLYSTRVVNIQRYSTDEIFQKKLLMFLPYYILRYEKNLPTARKEDAEKLRSLLQEYSDICTRLEKTLDEIGQSEIYADLIDLIRKISDHVIKSKPVRQKVGDVMGGRVLELRSERDRREGLEQGLEQGLQQGRIEGRIANIYELVQKGRLTMEEGAEELNVSVEQLENNMLTMGYQVPKV